MSGSKAGRSSSSSTRSGIGSDSTHCGAGTCGITWSNTRAGVCRTALKIAGKAVRVDWWRLKFHRAAQCERQLYGEQFSAANVGRGCAPCKGGAFQRVQAPPGNRSSRKQPEQTWR